MDSHSGNLRISRNDEKVIFSLFLMCVTLFSTPVMGGSRGQEPHSLEYHGYIRSSVGLSDGAASQSLFKAPGARGVYRLGNEPDTSIELQFDYRYALKEQNSKASIDSVVMIDGYKRHGDGNQFSIGHLSQAYLNFQNMFNSEVDIWMGRRYYERKLAHIMNHFWLNTGQNSHMAIGFEELDMGKGNLNMAVFRHEDNFTINGSSLLANSTILDVRWRKIEISKISALTFWGQAALRSDVSGIDYGAENGFSIGGWNDLVFDELKLTTVFLYWTGATINQSDFNPRPVREDQGWNLENANAFELNNTLTYEALPNYSLQWIVLFRQDEKGVIPNAKLDWYSTGFRVIYYLSRHINLVVDAGLDYVRDDVLEQEGFLNKVTGALQISENRGFYNRPVLRIFATYANWADDFIGQIGNIPGDAPYDQRSEGWSIGSQVEVWW